MASFRLLAGSELSLGTVLARRSRSPRKSSRGAEHAAGGKSVQFEKEAEAALGLPPGVHSYALLPIGYPWDGLASTPHRALRCRLRGSVVGSLTGICSNGKPGMCCSDGRLSESRRIHTPRTG